MANAPTDVAIHGVEQLTPIAHETLRTRIEIDISQEFRETHHQDSLDPGGGATATSPYTG
jgi:hypothetical protein